MNIQTRKLTATLLLKQHNVTFPQTQRYVSIDMMIWKHSKVNISSFACIKTAHSLQFRHNQTCALLTFFRITNLRIPDLLSNFAA